MPSCAERRLPGTVELQRQRTPLRLQLLLSPLFLLPLLLLLSLLQRQVLRKEEGESGGVNGLTRFSFFFLFFFQSSEQKKKSRSDFCKMTIFPFENSILGLGGQGVENGPFEGDAAFMLFIFSFVLLRDSFVLYSLQTFHI